MYTSSLSLLAAPEYTGIDVLVQPYNIYENFLELKLTLFDFIMIPAQLNCPKINNYKLRGNIHIVT